MFIVVFNPSCGNLLQTYLLIKKNVNYERPWKYITNLKLLVHISENHTNSEIVYHITYVVQNGLTICIGILFGKR